jgi:hypothetical protein
MIHDQALDEKRIEYCKRQIINFEKNVTFFNKAAKTANYYNEF